MEALIKTYNLTKTYGKQDANKDINISLYKGDIYGLIGKNGAGKSTLFKLLMGISKPTEGTIDLLGSTIPSGHNQARKNIGFMMGANFFPYLNALENLKYFAKIKGVDDDKHLNQLLELVELKDSKKRFKSYSLGMKQRLAIANAMIGNPDIIIMDEPVNGLDPEGIADFRRLILKLNKEYGITFIISSHILVELGNMCTRFGFIDKGILIEELTDEQLHDKISSSIYLKTNNNEKAIVILEETFNISNYKVINDSTIVLFEGFKFIGDINKELVNNDIMVSEISLKETSLEDYFLELIGGNNYA